MTKQFLLRRVANELLNWVFPSDDELCVICSRPVVSTTPSDVKRASEDGVAMSFGMCPFCLQDAHSSRVDKREDLLRIPSTSHTLPVFSCLPYEHFTRTLIRSWKYDGVVQLSDFFSSVLVSSWGVELSNRVHAVVPVPSSYDRTRKRGYDHVGLLADHFATQCQLPSRSVLERKREVERFTASQTSKNRTDRYRQLDGVYRCRQTTSLANKRILLVDDVVTTGSTLVHCASQLYQTGVKDIAALVIARVL